jgi:catechol 2,3-dioxygenase-like lactoylglutathione lyase family enzyme
VLTNIDYVVINVRDQRAALDFYVGKLGFELRHCSPGLLHGGYALHVAPHGGRTALVLALGVASKEVLKNRIMLTCDDMRRTYDELREKGVEVTMHPIGGMALVRFVDPDGNEFLLSDNNQNWIDEGALNRLRQGVPDYP